MIAPRVGDRRPLAVLLLSLVGLSWLTLVVWGVSPYSRYLSHEAIEELGGRVSLGYAGLAVVFVAAWVLMTVAMMLPTALPLVLLFHRFVAARRDAARLTAAIIAGYLLVWTLFGAAAHLNDLGVHTAVAHSRWLEERSWAISAVTIVVAGTYQFTPLKYLCLEKCRSPFSFIVAHWHGRKPILEAFRLGIHHGIFCVGCCWALMLLMFAVGVGNVGWMLGLGAIMAIEKNVAWGRRLTVPLGVLLLVVGMSLMLAHAGLGSACAHDGSVC